LTEVQLVAAVVCHPLLSDQIANWLVSVLSIEMEKNCVCVQSGTVVWT